MNTYYLLAITTGLHIIFRAIFRSMKISRIPTGLNIYDNLIKRGSKSMLHASKLVYMTVMMIAYVSLITGILLILLNNTPILNTFTYVNIISNGCILISGIIIIIAARRIKKFE